MRIIKFKTYKNIKNWLSSINLNLFFKIQGFLFVLITIVELIPINEIGKIKEDIIDLLPVYGVLFFGALLLLLNSYIGFSFSEKNKILNEQEKRKLKLEEIKYKNKKLFKWKKKKNIFINI